MLYAFLPFRLLLARMAVLKVNCGLLCRVQSLILSPTRELAGQTEKIILALGDFMNVQAHSCVGGKSLGGSLFSARIPCPLASLEKATSTAAYL